MNIKRINKRFMEENNSSIYKMLDGLNEITSRIHFKEYYLERYLACLLQLALFQGNINKTIKESIEKIDKCFPEKELKNWLNMNLKNFNYGEIK